MKKHRFYGSIIAASLAIVFLGILYIEKVPVMGTQAVYAGCSSIGTAYGECSDSCNGGCEDLGDGLHFNCIACTNDNSSSGSNTCVGGIEHPDCPQGYIGYRTERVNTDCSVDELENTCTCYNNPPQNLGCPAGYTGTHTQTTNCQGDVVDDQNNCVAPAGCESPRAMVNGQCQCPASSQVYNPDTNTCNSLSCDTTYFDEWDECSQANWHPGVPPDDNYFTWYTTHYSYPNCGYADETYVHYGNCPRNPTPPPTEVTINIPSPPASGGGNSSTPIPWTVTSGAGGNGGGGGVGPGTFGVEVQPDANGATITLTVPSTPGCLSPVITNNITGSGGTVTVFGGENVQFTVTCTPPVPAFDYSISFGSMSPIRKGGVDQFGQMPINVNLTAGTAQQVSLSLSSSPDLGSNGIAYSFAPVSCSPSCQSTLNFTVHSNATVGTYHVTVTGTPNSRSSSFDLSVQNSPDLVVTCTPSPGTALLGQPVTWTAGASGGSGTGYTYSWSGTNIPTSPAPTSNPYTITYTTIGPKTAIATVRDSIGNTGSCSAPAGLIQINFNPQFKEF